VAGAHVWLSKAQLPWTGQGWKLSLLTLPLHRGSRMALSVGERGNRSLVPAGGGGEGLGGGGLGGGGLLGAAAAGPRQQRMRKMAAWAPSQEGPGCSGAGGASHGGEAGAERGVAVVGVAGGMADWGREECPGGWRMG